MAVKHITLVKVEIAQSALSTLIECEEVPAVAKASLRAAIATIKSLTPHQVVASDHTPVEYDRGMIGCRCGFCPPKRPARGSMWMAPYNSHLARLGLPRNNAPIVKHGI
jgi:hypothetical protein